MLKKCGKERPDPDCSGKERPDPDCSQGLAKKVIEKSPEPINMNWVILDFAALVCKKRKPLCDTCPLCNVCKKRGL